ncbi:VOC family protein [Nocardia sp. CA-135953]|uniref:VOC family protein n=1 Tax=Nocardia sp. CA-135953 TaxID=3239978 RepID=UPI003D990352
MTPTVGGVCWIDLGVADIDTATAFYRRLFGWTVADPDDTGYRIALLHGHPVAAFGPAEDPGPPYWTVYVETGDITAGVAAAEAAGGTVVAAPEAAGDAGVAAIVRSPHGIPISLWQPGNHLGTYLAREHGALAGVDLRMDPEKSAPFLRLAFGWQVHPDSTIVHSARIVATWSAGPTALRPTPWLVRFHVTDVPATRDRALELGATPVLEEPGTLIDPTGAAFALTAI